MRHISPLATFVLAALVATSAAEAAGGATTFPAPQALESDEEPIADPTPREIVNFSGPQKPGTVIINTSERRLYFVLSGQQAMEYAVGVGRPGFEWAGVEHIANKREWPDWTPPSRDAQATPRPAAPHGRRHRQSARRSCDVSLRHALSHPRLERA